MMNISWMARTLALVIGMGLALSACKGPTQSSNAYGWHNAPSTSVFPSRGPY